MPFDPASDRAFQLFIEAYGKAWAPKPSPEAEPLDPPPTDDEETVLVTEIIVKPKAPGETPF